jgi:hypothetical protein
LDAENEPTELYITYKSVVINEQIYN